MFVQTLIIKDNGRMVELVDTLDQNNGRDILRVRVSLRPPKMRLSEINSLVELYLKNSRLLMERNHFEMAKV